MIREYVVEFKVVNPHERDEDERTQLFKYEVSFDDAYVEQIKSKFVQVTDDRIAIHLGMEKLLQDQWLDVDTTVTVESYYVEGNSWEDDL